MRGTQDTCPSHHVMRPVHPRVCGEHISERTRTWLKLGSSPRVRGTQHDYDVSCRNRRFIPACAGNTTDTSQRLACPPVHPRVCGEHCNASATRAGIIGSSPRVRGTHLQLTPQVPDSRFIPACAGKHISNSRRKYQIAGSSPRVRGTPDPFGYLGSV